MVKKIMIGIFAAILVVAIGTAAYNVVRTQAASATNVGTVGQVWNAQVGNGQGGNGQGGNGQGGKGQGNGSGIPLAQAQANLSSAKTIHGTVSTFSYGTLTIQADDGQSMGAQIGNSNYATTIGFTPKEGDKLTVYGFTGDQGLFSAITITLDGSGKVYTFRDAATGRPAWAGGGRNQSVAQP